MTVKRMDNVGIVVEDIDAAIESFIELGLTLEGRMPIEGEWAGRVTGVRDQHVEIAMMRTPDGHGRLELSRQRSRYRVRSPHVPGELIGILARHVHRRGHRRYPRPTRETRRIGGR